MNQAADLKNSRKDMVMGRNLWGEIEMSEEEEILRTAREAAKKKGHATYSDFSDFIERIVQEAESSLKGRALQRAQTGIRDTLKNHGWVRRIEERKKVVFYPPDSPLLRRSQMTLNIDNSDGHNNSGA